MAEGGSGIAMGALEAALRFRVARQGLLASNVANADTPGYRRTDLRFEGALERAVQVERRDPRHLGGAASGGQAGWKLERAARRDAASRPDGNGVDFDRELVALSRNAGAFTEAANVHSRLVALMRMAITGNDG